MSSPFHIEALSAVHDRKAFSSGEPVLDRYLQTQVGQDIRRDFAKCFVAVDLATAKLAGYYTLAATEILMSELPDDMARKLPKYSAVPCVKIGRLAVDQFYHGRGLGRGLLGNAFQRVINSPIAAFALVVDAKSDAAVSFYQRHGFCLLSDERKTLYLPFSVAEKRLLQ